MSQQHGFIPPPPPPPNASGRPGTPPLAAGESHPQRRRPAPAQPASIRTNFLRTHGIGASSSHTPASVTSGHSTPFPYSPVTPVALNPRTPGALNVAPQATSPGTPGIAMEPYNPRQWTQRQVSGTQRVFQRAQNVSTSTREATGMEGMLLNGQ